MKRMLVAVPACSVYWMDERSGWIVKKFARCFEEKAVCSSG